MQPKYSVAPATPPIQEKARTTAFKTKEVLSARIREWGYTFTEAVQMREYLVLDEVCSDSWQNLLWFDGTDRADAILIVLDELMKIFTEEEVQQLCNQYALH